MADIVQSDIQVSVTPVAVAGSIEKLRAQIQDAFNDPIKITFDAGKISATVASQLKSGVKSATKDVGKVMATEVQGELRDALKHSVTLRAGSNEKQAYTTYIRELLSPQIYGGVGKFAKMSHGSIWSGTSSKQIDARYTKSPELKRLAQVYAREAAEAEKVAKAQEKARQVQARLDAATISKGQKTLSSFQSTATDTGVANLSKYNANLQSAYTTVKQLLANGAPSSSDVQGWKNLTEAIELYRQELSKAKAERTAQREVEAAAQKDATVVTRGKDAFNSFNFEAEAKNVERLSQYNAKLQQAYNTVNTMTANGTALHDESDVEYYKRLAEAVSQYYVERKKARELEALANKDNAAAQKSMTLADRYQQAFNKLDWDNTTQQKNVDYFSQYNSKLQTAYNELSNFITLTQGKETWTTKDLVQGLILIENYNTQLRNARANLSAINKEPQTQANFNNLLQQAQGYYNKYASNIQMDSGLFTRWQNFFADLNSTNFYTGNITQFRAEYAKLVSATQQLGMEAEKTGSKMSRIFGQHLTTAAAMLAINALRQGLRQVWSNVKELDEAIVDLQVSSGKTRAEVKALVSGYSDLAKELGSTTTEITTAADTWLRQGYDLSEANDLITSSIQLSVLGQMSSDEATKALTSTMKGYNIAADEASTIVDKFTTVDMNAAVSAGDLATAMAECAVTAKTAGVDIDTLTGYLTVVAETTQDSAETVGNFFKSMFARMGNIKSGRLVDPDTEESLSDVETVLGTLGIKLRENGNDWRDFDDVLSDVASKWNTYKDTQRRAIANAFGQTRNQEKFLVLMDNYSNAIEYADVAANSAGNAAEKYESYLSGIEAHINTLTSAFEGLSQELLDSEFVIGVTDFLTLVTEGLTSIVSLSKNLGTGAITPIVGLLGGVVGLKGQGIQNYGVGLDTAGNNVVTRNWFSNKDVKVLTAYNNALLKGASDVSAYYAALDAGKGHISNTADVAIKSANGTTVAIDGMTKSLNLAAIGAKLLNVALNVGVSMAISAAISLIDNWIRRAEVAHEKTAEIIAQYDEEKATIQSLKESISDNYDQLSELTAVKAGDDWSTELEDQYKQLKLQTAELERQLEIEEAKAAVSQREAADTLLDEVEKTTSSSYSAWGKDDTPEKNNFWDYLWVVIGPGAGTAQTYGSQSEVTDEYISKLQNLNELYEQGTQLTDDQLEQYQTASAFLTTIVTQYQGWIEQATGNPYLSAEIDKWQKLIDAISSVLNIDILGYSPVEDPTEFVKSAYNYGQGGMQSAEDAGVAEYITSHTATELKSDRSTEAWQWMFSQAQQANMSVDDFIDTLVELGYVSDDIADSNDSVAYSLEDLAKAANNSSEKAAAAYETLEDAVDEYNEANYITDDTIEAISTNIPGALEVLFDEEGALRDDAAAAMTSADALADFIEMQLQLRVQSALTALNDLKEKFNEVANAAGTAAYNTANFNLAQGEWDYDSAQAALSNFQKWRKSKAWGSNNDDDSSGGGSSSIYSDAYEDITDLTEHYIEMSELRQKRMDEESDEWKNESKQQIQYYQQLAEEAYNEISRLRAKGYDESNEEFRKLLQTYEGYLGSMYSIAKELWEQQKQEQEDAIQDQIDAENDRWEEREKQLDHEIDYYNALLDLEEQYQETISDVHTEIHDLDTELAKAKAYVDGSDLSLMTDEEHDRLVAQLRDIENEATNLYTNYQEKLSEVSADNTYELEYITDEFQRQYEILLKQYEVSKADLAVAKARRELENVLNERNVAMLVNGVWTWVADPESVQSAIEAVSEAEQDAEDSLTDLYNTQRTQLLEETISNIELQKNTEEAAHDAIIEGLEDQLEAVQDAKFVFEEFIQTLLDGTEGVSNALSGLISALGGTSSGSSSSSGTTKDIVVSAGDARPDGLKDGDIIYYRDSGGSLNPVLVGGPNPRPIGFKKGSLGTPAYTGTETEWWENVIQKYGGKGWSAFATGGVADFTGPAHLDGTTRNPEVVFNSTDAAKLYQLVHNTPNLFDQLVGGIQAKFASILPASVRNGNINTASTNNSKQVYWNGDLLLEGDDANNFLTTLERVLPIV